MDNSNMKRVKTRLALFEIEGTYGILSDMIDELCEFKGIAKLEPVDKIWLSSKLKGDYIRWIYENTPIDNVQQKLFENDREI